VLLTLLSPTIVAVIPVAVPVILISVKLPFAASVAPITVPSIVPPSMFTTPTDASELSI